MSRNCESFEDAWLRVMGRTPEEHIIAMNSSFELGRLVAKLSKKGFAFPAGFNQPLYRLAEEKQKMGFHSVY